LEEVDSLCAVRYRLEGTRVKACVLTPIIWVDISGLDDRASGAPESCHLEAAFERAIVEASIAFRQSLPVSAPAEPPKLGWIGSFPIAPRHVSLGATIPCLPLLVYGFWLGRSALRAVSRARVR
jgi:hypothetical protein